MERSRAITVAAIVSGGLLVAALGMTANAGILGAPSNDKVGQLNPVSATAPPTTIYIDDPVRTVATPAQAPAPTPASSHDDSGHDDGGERDD